MKKIEIKGIDEEIYYDNSLYNMPVYIWENDNLSGFYLSLCVKYGSIHTSFKYNKKEYNVPKGIAHYLEHIKFNESKDFKANDYYEKLGSDINAFTTFEYTNYEVTAHDHFEDNLSHLIFYVLNPFFTKQIINKERGIITEEIKSDKDDPYSNLFYRSLQNVFNKSHYRNLVSGDIADIKKISLDDIKIIFEAFYHPENMFLVVTGNVNAYKTMQIVNDTLKGLNIRKYNKPEIIMPKEPLKVALQNDIYTDNVMCPKVKMSFKLPLSKFKSYKEEELLIYSRLILNCNFGVSSDLKEELLENNMINSFFYSNSIFEDFLIITFTFESEVRDAVREKIMSKMKSLEVTSNYLKRVIKGCISDLILRYESKEVVSSMIQNDILFFDHIVNDAYDIYNSIKVKDLNKLAKMLWTPNNSTTMVIPKK